MVRSDVAREFWLKAACVAISIGLHAGLGVFGWQGLEAVPAKDEPVMVALVERLPARSDLPPPQLKAPSVAPARRAIPVRVPTQAKPEPPVEGQRTAPAPLVVEMPTDVVATDEPDETFSEAFAAGSAGSSGTGPAGRRRVESAGVSGLIKATPRYETNQPPHYPRLARQNRWEGTVRLRARISADGEIEALTLERSSGHDVLDRSALDGVQRWRFIPARQGGVPVACELSIPVAFRLTEP